MNRTLLDEHLRIKGREKWYASGKEIQPDPDVVLGFCSAARRRQGWRLQGPAPARGAGSASTEAVYFG